MIKKRAVFFISTLMVIVFLMCSCSSVSSKKVTAVKKASKEKIIVLAAASLTEAFTEMGKDIKKEKNIEISFDFAGSQQLVTLIEQDVSADVFASADTKNMDKVINEKKVEGSTIFTKNQLVIGKYKDSKININSLKDLAKDGVKIVVGDKSVPCGAYFYKAINEAVTDKVIDKDTYNKILKNIKSSELNVKDIVSKVAMGNADVGIVYKTDINKSNQDKIQIITDKEFSKQNVEYPVAIISASNHKKAAKTFIEYLTSNKGKALMNKYGFTVK